MKTLKTIIIAIAVFFYLYNISPNDSLFHLSTQSTFQNNKSSHQLNTDTQPLITSADVYDSMTWVPKNKIVWDV